MNGWWQAETNHRWMSRKAQLRLAGPSAPTGELTLRGRAPQQVALTITVNGVTCPPSRISTGPFELRYPVRKANVLELALEVSRTITYPSDGRELGLAFGTVEVAP